MNHGECSQRDRPYIIAYIRGERRVADSAVTLEHAKTLIARRVAKRHNRGERAEVFRGGMLVLALNTD